MALPDPIIKRRDGRLTIRLPARPKRGLTWVLLILFALPFIAGGGFTATAFVAPQLLGLHVTSGSPQASWGNKIVGGVICVFTVLLTAPIVMKALISRFGHSEIVLTRGRIRCIERVGFIFLTSSRSLATLIRLDVVPPAFTAKSRGEPPMNLDGYFTDGMPFTLAMFYPTDTLKPIAKELLSAIPRPGG
jgi:hypothetical protein